MATLSYAGVTPHSYREFLRWEGLLVVAQFELKGFEDARARPVPFAEPHEYDYMEKVPRAALAETVRSGELPHVRTARYFTGEKLTIQQLEAVMPPRAKIERSLQSPWDVHLVVRGFDFAYRIETFPEYVNLEIAASSCEQVDAVEEFLREKLAKEADPSNTVRFASWVQGEPPHRFEVPRVNWLDIEANYPKKTWSQLQSLMSMTAETNRTGRIIVLHGEPGTGKTWAIRALATEWSSWCIPELVMDPDQAFASASYLRGIAMDAHRSQARLLICEDVDGIVTSRRTGGFERLLNMTDGILGQGQDLMVLISTNVRPEELDPALVRPGRCMAQVTFERFPVSEARKRLGRDDVTVDGPKTLSEIYQLHGDIARIGGAAEPVSIGTYL
jgi:hypothetical protein